MFVRSMLVFIFVVSVLMSFQVETAEAQEPDRIARLERIAADLGALGMTADAARYQTKATNERAALERQVKATAVAFEVSQVLAKQVGQYQQALANGKVGPNELAEAARKLLEKHQQLGKYLASLSVTRSQPVQSEIAATQPANWGVVSPRRGGEIVVPSQPTLIAQPNVQLPPQAAVEVNEPNNDVQVQSPFEDSL